MKIWQLVTYSGLTVARFILICIKYYICKRNYSRHVDLQTKIDCHLLRQLIPTHFDKSTHMAVFNKRDS